jgi:hypothetical protein
MFPLAADVMEHLLERAGEVREFDHKTVRRVFSRMNENFIENPMARGKLVTGSIDYVRGKLILYYFIYLVTKANPHLQGKTTLKVKFTL